MEIINKMGDAVFGDKSSSAAKVVLFLVVQALVYLILSNSSDVFSRNKLRSFSFKPARSSSISRILALISDLPSDADEHHSPTATTQMSSSASKIFRRSLSSFSDTSDR